MSKMTDELKKWIRRFRSGKVWLNKLHSEATIRSYLAYFKQYCDLTHKNPDGLIELKMEGMRKVGTTEEFLAEELHDSTILGLDATESSKANMSTAILSFYKHNRRPLVEVRRFERPEAKSRRPTLQDIKDMANAVRWRRDKALIWFIASAPFRRETVEKLTWEDLVETKNPKVPIKLVIKGKRLKGRGRARYRGLQQISFLHAWAHKQLLAYKKELLRMMRKVKKIEGFQITPETPLFMVYKNGNRNGEPKALANQSMYDIFEMASLNAWGDLEKKRFSPHDFRDFVDNALKNARVVEVDRAPLIGHKIKGVEKHYQDPDHKDLMACFESALQFLSPDPELSKTTITEADRITGLKAETNQRIRIMIITTKEEIARYEAEIKHWEGMILIAEKSRKLEPQKDKEYGELVRTVQKQIVTAKEQISILKDSLKRLEKLL